MCGDVIKRRCFCGWVGLVVVVDDGGNGIVI